MPITPMFHIHGWGLPYVATTLGVKQVYPGRYHPDALVGLIHRETVSFSHCVPTILQMVLASARTKGLELPGRKVVIGGAALPQALARQAWELGVDIFTGYGMSETSPVLTLAISNRTWRPGISIGRRRSAARPAAQSRWSRSGSSTRR